MEFPSWGPLQFRKYPVFLIPCLTNHSLPQNHPLAGFRLLLQDAKEVRQIRTRMLASNTDRWNLPYCEMEKLRQFRRDMIKAIPLLLISIPPFANYVVFILMYLFPRHILIPHFWTSQQLVEFQAVYHTHRAQSYRTVIDALMKAAPSITDVNLKACLMELCSKVQKGGHPLVSEVHALRTVFVGSKLELKRLYADHMRHLCSLLFLTSHLPSVLIGRRLNSHAKELMHLDRALSQLGLHQLSDAEIKQQNNMLTCDRDVPLHLREWKVMILQKPRWNRKLDNGVPVIIPYIMDRC